MEKGKHLVDKYKSRLPYKKVTTENIGEIEKETEYVSLKTHIIIQYMSKMQMLFFYLITFFVIRWALKSIYLYNSKVVMVVSFFLAVGIAYLYNLLSYPKNIEINDENFVVKYRTKKDVFEIEDYEFVLEYPEEIRDSILHSKNTNPFFGDIQAVLIIYEKGTYKNEFQIGKYLNTMEINLLVNHSQLSKNLKTRTF